METNAPTGTGSHDAPTATDIARRAVETARKLSPTMRSAIHRAELNDKGVYTLRAHQPTMAALKKHGIADEHRAVLTDFGHVVRAVIRRGADEVLAVAEQQDADKSFAVARLLAERSGFSLTAAAVARYLQLDVAEVRPVLEEMARDRRILVDGVTAEGRTYYRAAYIEPPVPGVPIRQQPDFSVETGKTMVRTSNPADTSEETANGIPLPEPGQPLRVVWFVPEEQRAVLWTRDGVTFEAPLLVPPADPENPYRVDWPLTAWTLARPSSRAVEPIVAVADVGLDDRRESLPQYGMPLMVCGDDELVWKAADGKVYTTPDGGSPFVWDSPGAEHGWVVDFTRFEEVHPYDVDSGPDHEHLLERPF